MPGLERRSAQVPAFLLSGSRPQLPFLGESNRRIGLFNHIVVPLDGSNLSEAALAYAAPLALRLNSKVVLLHADSDPYADMFGVQGTARDEGSLQNVADYLQSVSERLQSEVFSAKLTTKSARRLQSY